MDKYLHKLVYTHTHTHTHNQDLSSIRQKNLWIFFVSHNALFKIIK